MSLLVLKVVGQPTAPMYFDGDEGEDYALSFTNHDGYFSTDALANLFELLKTWCSVTDGARGAPVETLAALCPPASGDGFARASLNLVSGSSNQSIIDCLINHTNLWCIDYDRSHSGIGSQTLALEIGGGIAAATFICCIAGIILARCRRRAKEDENPNQAGGLPQHYQSLSQ